MAGRDGNISVVFHQSSSNFWSLGVEGNGDGTARGELGSGGSGIVNDGLVVLVGSVGEVHADYISEVSDADIPMFKPASMSLPSISTVLVLGPMVPMMEVWMSSVSASAHLSEELLVLGKVIESSLQAGQPGKLGSWGVV